MKRLVVLILVSCLLLGTQVQAVTSKRLGGSGMYEIRGMYSGKSVFSCCEFSKKQKTKAKKLYKKSPLQFHKKYSKKMYIKYGAVKTRFKNNILTFWGGTVYKGNGYKKKYKCWKYKLKISKNASLYGNSPDGTYMERGSRKDLVYLLRKPTGLWYKFFINNGVVYKIYAIS